ncbi:histidinol-phosphatase HisJ [Bacillus tianshenii]|nr:histidinol-phosphatase HisJ [Bacillus tianshenii]
MKIDGHIHTPYCPHGSKDSFEEYIEQAIKQDFSTITFTEHAPLPPSFEDPTPDKDSSMPFQQLENYLKTLTDLKKKYANDIHIQTGLEIDFIEGFEQETTDFLQTYGHLLDDSILSVHFLKQNDHYFCLDFSDDTFQEMIHSFGITAKIYEAYFHTVKQSIKADLGPYKPKRIGHITLVHKFQKRFPCDLSFERETTELLQLVKSNGLELDYNAAGLSKPLCGEPYPTEKLVKQAASMGIPLVYGSDAHQANDVGQHYHQLQKVLLGQS